MQAFRLAERKPESKRKPEFQVSHNCLRRTLWKDSDHFLMKLLNSLVT